MRLTWRLNYKQKIRYDLPKEYLTILNDKEEIKKTYNSRGINLSYLEAILLKLAENVIMYKVIGTIEQKEEEIKKLFKDYSFNKMKAIFGFKITEG